MEQTGYSSELANPLTLAFDIGGSHLKAAVLKVSGEMFGEPVRVKTPKPAAPQAVTAALLGLSKRLGAFDRISIGFPGVVRGDLVLTAPNLGNKQWHGFRLGAAIAESLGKPVRMLNDASIQGLGVIAGEGLECVLTMGTGMGFALFREGYITPHLELSQHPIRTGKTYDEYVGNAALQSIGRRHWSRRIDKVIGILETVIAYDVLYIGGGNAKLITSPLPANVRIVSNAAGITGGVRLWDRRMDLEFAGQAHDR
ncbi:MAG: ROK family protein [Beijerinckiaceae bacterium]|nr:ROK family protein [Beijerinckiaceae bacterium]